MNVTVFGMMTTVWQENVYMLGLIDGLREGGPELHVGRPDPAHAGYTQAAASVRNGVSPNVIPAQYSIIAILSAVQPWNA